MDNQLLVRELRRFDSIRELFKSDFYRTHRSELRTLLNEPRIYEFKAAVPRLDSFLRVAQWNIEYGIQLTGIVDALNNHPLLRFADLILLNEVDDGVSRSGNVNVVKELGQRLAAHAIYGVEYLELADAPNTAALHGNAILTRHPFHAPLMFRLPICEDNFGSPQKRLGGRLVLIVDIEVASALTVAVFHWDVVN